MSNIEMKKSDFLSMEFMKSTELVGDKEVINLWINESKNSYNILLDMVVRDSLDYIKKLDINKFRIVVVDNIGYSRNLLIDDYPDYIKDYITCIGKPSNLETSITKIIDNIILVALDRCDDRTLLFDNRIEILGSNIKKVYRCIEKSNTILDM